MPLKTIREEWDHFCDVAYGEIGMGPEKKRQLYRCFMFATAAAMRTICEDIPELPQAEAMKALDAYVTQLKEIALEMADEAHMDISLSALTQQKPIRPL